jgi:hypothetical protein
MRISFLIILSVCCSAFAMKEQKGYCKIVFSKIDNGDIEAIQALLDTKFLTRSTLEQALWYISVEEQSIPNNLSAQLASLIEIAIDKLDDFIID